MNPRGFGDSFDIVKRFFIKILKDAGYEVYVEPIFIGDWDDNEHRFISFIGAKEGSPTSHKSALFIDPETGIGDRTTSKHITIQSIIRHLDKFEVVMVYDQSFSRSRSIEDQMREKLNLFTKLGGHGFYYNSHARFLFVTKVDTITKKLVHLIQQSGLPRNRLISLFKT